MQLLSRHKWLIVIILIASLLRVVALLKAGSFWFDEMFSFTYSQKPWLPSLHYWLWETNPPLHLLFLKFWFYIFPANEFWARLPSALFGILSVSAIFILAKKMFNERAGLIAALLLALSPYHIFISAVARGYSLLIFLALACALAFQKLITAEKISRPNKVNFFIAHLGILFVHLTGFYLIAAEAAALLAAEKKKFFVWLKQILPVLILAGLWLAPSVLLKTNRRLFGESWFFNIYQTPLAAIQNIQLLFTGFGALLIAVPIICAMLFALGYAIYRERYNFQRGLFMLCLAALFFPLLGAAFWGFWNIKFIIIALPFFIVFLAASMARLPFMLATAMACLIFLPGIFALFRFLPVDNWPAFNSVTKNYKTDKKTALIFGNFVYRLSANRYYRGPIPALFYFPFNESYDDAVVKYNYLRYRHPLSETVDWTKKNITPYDNLYILEGEKNDEINFDEALKQSGFSRAESAPSGLLEQTLVHYVKN